MVHVEMFLFLTCFATVVKSEYVMPTITLESCMYETASFRIDNMSVGGILYIRTDTAYNIIPTTEGTVYYECAFEVCNIEWDVKFHVVVQKRVLYQTGDDKIQWSVCNSDFGSIRPVNIDFGIMDMDNLTLVMTKPDTVLMRFFDNETEYVGGSTVKLGQKLNMRLEVLNNKDDFFDITPKACWASTINLIEDRCPVDESLFSGFTRLSAGNITNTFYMLRPTTTMAGVYDVTFTCLLEVCMYNCQQTLCNDTVETESRSRRRRGADRVERRPSMVLGATLKALAEGEEIIIKKEDAPTTDICFTTEILVLFVLALLFVFLTESTMTGFNFYQFVLCQRAITLQKSAKKRVVAETPLASPELSVKACDESRLENDLNQTGSDNNDDDNADNLADDSLESVNSNEETDVMETEDSVSELHDSEVEISKSEVEIQNSGSSNETNGNDIVAYRVTKACATDGLRRKSVARLRRSSSDSRVASGYK